MKFLLTHLFVFSLLIFSAQFSVAQITKAEPEATLIRDGDSGNIFDTSNCNRAETRGIFWEPLFEAIQGRFEKNQLNCCAISAERACGDDISEMADGVEIKSSAAANCLGQAKGSQLTACGSNACKAWGKKCKDFGISEIKEALQDLRSESSGSAQDND